MRAENNQTKITSKPSILKSVALLLCFGLIIMAVPSPASADPIPYGAPPGSFVGATQNDQFINPGQNTAPPASNPNFQNSVAPVSNYYPPQNFTTPAPAPVNNYGFPNQGGQPVNYGQYAQPSGYGQPVQGGQPYEQAQQGSVQQNYLNQSQPTGAIQPFAQSQAAKPDGWPADFPDSVSPNGQTTVDNTVQPMDNTSQPSGGGGGASMAAGIGKALLGTVGSVMAARSMSGMGGYGSPYGMGGYGMGGMSPYGYGSPMGGGLANTALRMFTGGGSMMGGYGSPMMGGYGSPMMGGYGNPYGGGMMNLMNMMRR